MKPQPNTLRKALIIFVKNPQLGRVKTRIAKDVGDAQALEIYQSLLQHTHKIALGVDATRFLFYSDFIEPDDAWTSDHFTLSLQTPGDLGIRMKSAFSKVLQTHQQAVIIGSDCIQLTPELVNKAYTSLDTHDAVIGPSLDGGYYLLGLNQVDDTLFNHMKWSTQSVYRDTVERAQKLQWTVDTLETLSDIDFVEDWEKYKHLL